MFIINRDENNIAPLSRKSFSELGFREREHLQEWIAKKPDILGQELLIIQKEFDGWNNSRERIDLLAIDKDGALVVVENKLDDSGRDVAWQAIKYAAYCSSLTKSEIADIYQKYLDARQNMMPSSARQNICEFLGEEDFNELSLNEGQTQKIILVGAKFRNEVTATCLWLLAHKIDVRCIRIEPYVLDDQIFLNVDQIIPPPEAEEYMIRVGTKEAEEKSTRGITRLSHSLRLEFFGKLLESLTSQAQKIYANRSPGRDHWLTGSTGASGVHYSFSFLKNALRVELSMQRSSSDENKYFYDKLLGSKAQIETDFGDDLDWMRLDDRIASRIVYEITFDSYNKDNWSEAIKWLDTNMNNLISSLDPHLSSIINSKNYLSRD